MLALKFEGKRVPLATGCFVVCSKNNELESNSIFSTMNSTSVQIEMVRSIGNYHPEEERKTLFFFWEWLIRDFHGILIEPFRMYF